MSRTLSALARWLLQRREVGPPKVVERGDLLLLVLQAVEFAA
jgi:hypothetical protein